MEKKPESLREVSIWETLDRDIFTTIFSKLDVMDLTQGTSRVCISWFLASHDKTLWQTVDLAKFQTVVVYRPKLGDKVRRPVVFYDHRVEQGLSSRNLMQLLVEITRLSGTVPKSLIFDSHSYIKKKDLMFAARRMPNIEKLVLPRWCYQTEKSCRLAFSQWKNLKTLIIAHDHNVNGEFEFQAVGETCRNLTNFKFLGYLGVHNANLITRYFKKLKRLSLRCSFVDCLGVITLIVGLQNHDHVILNVTHCAYQFFNMFPDIARETWEVPHPDLVQPAVKKLDKYIKCSSDCTFCKGTWERFQLTSLNASPWHPYDKDWHYDEIEEFVFYRLSQCFEKLTDG